MKFQVNKIYMPASCLQGYINIEFDKLVGKLGQPQRPSYPKGVSRKTTAEWIIEFEDGTVVRIYNWKNGRTKGGYRNIINWQVGGVSEKAAEYVEALFQTPVDTEGCGVIMSNGSKGKIWWG